MERENYWLAFRETLEEMSNAELKMEIRRSGLSYQRLSEILGKKSKSSIWQAVFSSNRRLKDKIIDHLIERKREESKILRTRLDGKILNLSKKHAVLTPSKSPKTQKAGAL